MVPRRVHPLTLAGIACTALLLSAPGASSTALAQGAAPLLTPTPTRRATAAGMPSSPTATETATATSIASATGPIQTTRTTTSTATSTPSRTATATATATPSPLAPRATRTASPTATPFAARTPTSTPAAPVIAAAAPRGRPGDKVPGQLLVRLGPPSGVQSQLGQLAAGAQDGAVRTTAGASASHELVPSQRLLRLEVSPGTESAALARLRARSDVLYAEEEV